MGKRVGSEADRPEERPAGAGEDDRALARMIGCAALVGLGVWAGLLAALLL